MTAITTSERYDKKLYSGLGTIQARKGKGVDGAGR